MIANEQGELVMSELNDSELNELLSNPVHSTDLFKRIMQDFASPKSRSYRRPRRLPRKNTRRRRTR